MPIIPTAKGSQVLTPGSPVSIGNGDDTISTVLNNVGKALSSFKTETNNNRDGLIADIAADKYRAKLLRESSAQKQLAPIGDDVDGTKAFDAIKERTKPDLEQLDATFENDNQRLMFQSKIGNYENDVLVGTTATEVAKRAKYNSVLLDKYVADKTSSLRDNPGDYETVIKESEVSILDKFDGSPLEKEQYVQKMKQNALKETVYGLSSKKFGLYDQARDLVESNSEMFATPEKKEQFLKQIKDTRIKNLTEEDKLIVQEVAGLKAKQAKQEIKAAAIYDQALADSVGDIEKRNIVVDQIMSDPRLSAERKARYTRVDRTFNKEAEESVEFQVRSKLLENDLDGAKKFIENQDGKTIGKEKVNELMGMLRTATTANKSPESRIQNNAANKYIRESFSKGLGDFGNEQVLRQQSLKASQLYGELVAKNPTVDRTLLAEQAVDIIKGEQPKIIVGIPAANQNNFSVLTKKRDELKDKVVRGEKLRQDERIMLQQIGDKLKLIEKKQKERGDAGNTKADGTSPGFVPSTR